MVELSERDVWQRDVGMRSLYNAIEEEKAKALDKSFWFQKAWRGFIASGSESGFLKRLSVKLVSGVSLLSLPMCSLLSMWGVYEVSCTIIQTFKEDSSDPNNNFNTIGHVPEWVIAALVSLCLAWKIVDRCVNEDRYKTVLKLFQRYLAEPSLCAHEKSRLYQTALKELKEIESDCLFSKSTFSRQLQLLENV